MEKSVAYLPTPIVVGDHVYAITEKGMASCLEMKTGKVVWQERIDAEFSASPVCAGDTIYATADDGEVFVLKASPVYTLLAHNALGGRCQATPALAGGRIIFRTERELIAFTQKR
jgi:outer membrane protein assembly factor BamB